MSVSNHPIKANLVKVRGLELQHFVDASPVDLVRCSPNLCGRAIGTTEPSLNKLFAILIQQIKCVEVCTCRDLDQFSEPVSYLSFRKCPQKAKVEERVHRGMVGTESVLVVAIVDSNLDRNGRIDETNDCRGNADIIGVSAIGGTRESA